MASRLQVAPTEYLSTSFEGTDREYVRGEIVGRSMPDYLHGKMQLELGIRIGPLRSSHRLFPCSETRMRLASDLYRIPDIAIFAESEPTEPVPGNPPLVVVEIISPDDRHSELIAKLLEYQKWGVPHIWVIDPRQKTLAAFSSGALTLVPRLTLPGYPLELSAELFS